MTTAEQAITTRNTHGKNSTQKDMLDAIAAIRANGDGCYLDHPEIIIGLAEGRFGAKGLARRVEEMAEADAA